MRLDKLTIDICSDMYCICLCVNESAPCALQLGIGLSFGLSTVGETVVQRILLEVSHGIWSICTHAIQKQVIQSTVLSINAYK